MEITGKNGVGSRLEFFLKIFFYLGILILLGLPFALSEFGLKLNSSMYLIYPNGIVLLIIMRKFIKLFNSLKNNNPFCEDNVKTLKGTALVTLIGSLFWSIDFIYELFLAKAEIVTVLVLLFLAILFYGVSIALYILAELFKQAVEYKKENELTI